MSDQLLSDLASLHIAREIDPERKGPLAYVVLVLAIASSVAVLYFFALPFVAARLFKTEVEFTEIVSVSPAQAQVELTATGYVVPQNLAKLGAKIVGRVARVLVHQGQRVQAGDVLLHLDELEQQAAVAAAHARALAAQARVHTARANLAETHEQARRARGLAQRDVGPVSSAVDLEARSLALTEMLKAAEAEALAAHAEVTAQKTTLQQLTLVAPISGTVLSKPPEVGEIIGPQNGLSGMNGLIELSDLSRDSLVVETDVPEARLHQVRVGDPCEIVLDAFPDRRLRGKTLEILPRVNRAKASIAVKVSFTDSVEGVLPDMAARVSFLRKELDVRTLAQAPKVLIPASAVTERGGVKVVFMVDKDQNRALRTPVVLGPPLANGFELVQGPPVGTRVVRDPAPGLNDGQRVKDKGSREE